ncbi:alpha/beta hydrolase [Arthrobacter sp. CAN_C5]|uniref:alpha/beta hydrolase n=1 Tax=Arthrobacter sp. CAN_C5 TaxID=2760706 RepID=UPI001AE1B213|nr:alpha/beta hydrolase [Arthrobacter sp. CAN_C5]MBP2216599.1 alpha-beta hydrolase superfamily lysophospholipase [Arthrobacter sp. CAN_C5]
MGLIWKPDYLGDGFTCADLPLGTDDEGPCVATLVSYTPPTPENPMATHPPAGNRFHPRVWWSHLLDRLPQRPERGSTNEPASEEPPVTAVLYLHGWSDYFLHRGLAEFYAARGVAFYALDLHKYGRSLRDGQTPGYVGDLADYDDDLDAALRAMASHIRERQGAEVPVHVHLMAHSTGALIASLWVHRNPGRIASLILNSPWLDVQGSAIFRGATQGLLDPITRFKPKARLKLPEIGFYWRSISNTGDGDWDINPLWRPEFGFSIRAGWVAAVLAGHAQVRRGLDIDVPVLVLASTRSSVSPVWSEAMLTSDSVLDVTLMTQRALQLGPNVTVCRYEGALHDVLLSKEPVRREVYLTLDGWLRCQELVGRG